MNDVVATVAFTGWFLALTAAEQKQVLHVVEKLSLLGLKLAHPHSTDIKGSRFAFRELRVTSGASGTRVIYAYDPRRDAVLILGATKAGNSDRFYKRLIAECEGLWTAYLAAQAEAEAKEAARAKAAQKRKK